MKMINFKLKLLYLIKRITSKLDRLIHNYIRKQKLIGTPGGNLTSDYYGTFDLLWLIEKESYKINSICDIGAHHGYWTLLAKSFFPNAQINAFEPIDQHLHVLKSNTNNLAGINYFNFGLGEVNKEVLINIATNSDSSSILNFHENLLKEYNQKNIGTTNIQLKSMSDLIKNGLINIPDLIKLDIQGYELKAIQGIGDYLKSIKYIIIEISLVELYINQPSFAELTNYLDEYGFTLSSINELRGFSYKIVQCDMLYINNKI